LNGGALGWELLAEHFEQKRAERIDVDPSVERCRALFHRLHLLGRHVPRSTNDAARARSIDERGRAEVEQLYVATRKKDVLRLEVAVQDSAFVRLAHDLCDGKRDTYALLVREVFLHARA
jgi:hypothetical protein